MQALNCLIYLPLLQCCSVFCIVVVVILSLTVVLILITVTATSACFGSLERDRLPDELQQIDFCPAPCLELSSKQEERFTCRICHIVRQTCDLEANWYIFCK
jgi:hypothetical protein